MGAAGLRAAKVQDGGPAARRGIRPGDCLVEVNGEAVEDELDLHFQRSAGGYDLLTFEREGKIGRHTFPAGELGIEWHDFDIELCRNRCVFCYVHQNPKGMRKSIYVMDEDIRLSFLYGSFTTLSNLSEKDRSRIVQQGFSPFYVSVHATNEELRSRLLRGRRRANPRPILEDIDYLIDAGIEVHTQAVVCRGLNDGAALERTVFDLAERFPGVRTLACVPVGLTTHRRNLPALEPFDRSAARAELRRIQALQEQCRARLGNTFVYAADEFYALAELELPPLAHYGDLEQLDNGVGLVRYWQDIIQKALSGMEALSSGRKVLALTGVSAQPLVAGQFRSAAALGLQLRVDAVDNTLFGPSVTVANLLPARDLLEALDRARISGFAPDLVLLPPKVLNADDLFLDDLSLVEVQSRAGIACIPAPDDPGALARVLAPL